MAEEDLKQANQNMQTELTMAIAITRTLKDKLRKESER